MGNVNLGFENLDAERELTLALFNMAESYHNKHECKKSFIEVLYTFAEGYDSAEELESHLHMVLGWN